MTWLKDKNNLQRKVLANTIQDANWLVRCRKITKMHICILLKCGLFREYHFL